MNDFVVFSYRATADPIVFQPVWDEYYEPETIHNRTVETLIEGSSSLAYLPLDNLLKSYEDNDGRFLSTLSRLVFLKVNNCDEIHSFLMTLLREKVCRLGLFKAVIWKLKK